MKGKVTRTGFVGAAGSLAGVGKHSAFGVEMELKDGVGGDMWYEGQAVRAIEGDAVGGLCRRDGLDGGGLDFSVGVEGMHNDLTRRIRCRNKPAARKIGADIGGIFAGWQ